MREFFGLSRRPFSHSSPISLRPARSADRRRFFIFSLALVISCGGSDTCLDRGSAQAEMIGYGSLMLQLLSVQMLSRGIPHEVRYINHYRYPDGRILVDQDDTTNAPEVLYHGSDTSVARMITIATIEQAKLDGYRWRRLDQSEITATARQRSAAGLGYPWHNPGRWLIP